MPHCMAYGLSCDICFDQSTNAGPKQKSNVAQAQDELMPEPSKSGTARNLRLFMFSSLLMLVGPPATIGRRTGAA